MGVRAHAVMGGYYVWDFIYPVIGNITRMKKKWWLETKYQERKERKAWKDLEKLFLKVGAQKKPKK